jgi:hypothetical protein
VKRLGEVWEEMELRWGHVAQKVISSESCVPAGVGPNGAFWGSRPGPPILVNKD